MSDIFVLADIAEDCNFKLLAEDKTSQEEFGRLVEENVKGYTQKKRLQEGLKAHATKVEEAENRLIVARNVGKFKGPNPEDKELTDTCTSHEIKEKVQTINAQVQAMIDAGSITHNEKPHVLDNLRARLAKAKEGGKAKLEEKLEGQITIIAKAPFFALPVTNIEKFHSLSKDIQSIEKLEKLPAKHLTKPLQDRINNRQSVQDEFDALKNTSTEWFELPSEFQPRLSQAIERYEAQEEERKRKEEEDAFELKKKEEQEALERKRAEMAKKEEELEKALEEKLAAKRAEAALRPVKEVPQPKKKEKPTHATVDLKHMFKDEREDREYEEVDDTAEVLADLEADKQRRELAKAYAELKKAQEEQRLADAEARKLRAQQKAALDQAQKAAQEAAEKVAAATKSAKKATASVKTEEKVANKPALKKKNSIDFADMDDETFERKCREEAEAREKKMKEIASKQLEQDKALEEKLAAKRAEAQAKPQKEVPQPKKKEKPSVATIDLKHMFKDDREYEIVDEADVEGEKQRQQELAQAYAELAKAQAEANALKAVSKATTPQKQTANSTKAAAKSVTKEKPPPRESQWGDIGPSTGGLSLSAAMTEEKFKAIDEKLAAKRAEAESKPTKEAPQQKKKEKKVAKMSLLDFYDEKIVAEKEAVLDKEREKEAAEKEAAREAEEAAEWAQWESAELKARQEAAEMNANKTGIDAPQVAPKLAAKKPAPKPARKPPVELENKWGAPVSVPQDSGEEGEDGDDTIGPSLAEALAVAPVKKTPPPQPKKKEKKKWAKLDATAIGFDAEDLNHA